MLASRIQFLPFLSRILLMVMLATVFAPSFSWEAVEGRAQHEHLNTSMAEMQADEHADCHRLHEVGPDQMIAGDLSQHCCPGHVLGHLLGGVSAWPVFAIAPVVGVSRLDVTEAFSSRVPEGLERPPRFAA